jgi:hypothetical protein
MIGSRRSWPQRGSRVYYAEMVFLLWLIGHCWQRGNGKVNLPASGGTHCSAGQGTCEWMPVDLCARLTSQERRFKTLWVEGAPVGGLGLQGFGAEPPTTSWPRSGGL